MGSERKPPQSARELLDRYAAGERDFTAVRLRGADLQQADLANANLTRADFVGADLFNACLNGAILAEADLSRTMLMGGALSGAKLRGAKLIGMIAMGVRGIRADLSEADLSDANFSHAVFDGTTFARSNLTKVDLSAALLRRIDFTESKLTETNFRSASLHDAQFAGAHLWQTHLEDIDLSQVIEAVPPVEIVGPIFVDYRTIIRSISTPNIRGWLLRTGMPEVFVEYMIDCARTLTPGGVFRMLQSTFISYGGPDTDFAQRLNDALLKNGVATFFFAKDAIPGRKLHRLMREGVNQHDRVILVCSQASLDRPGVLNEITETLQREARDGGKEYLIPITLDDYVFTGWKPEDPGIAQAIKDRVVADFRGAETDPAKFNEGLLRLIAALKR